MKNTLAGQNLPLSPLASQSHVALHRTRPDQQHQQQHHLGAGSHHHHHKAVTAPASSSSAMSSKSRAFNYTMHDCYERLKELVPTIPKNKKITRVEILQHVIDYIQDLQSALESHNLHVRRSQMGGQSRAPFTSLTPQQNLDMLNGLADLENCDWQRTLLNLTTVSRGSKLHPYETPDSSPETPSTYSSC